MSSHCGNCLFQFDRNSDEKGDSIVFCLVKGIWIHEDRSCNRFTEYADVSKEVRTQLALGVRQEEAESDRVSKLVRTNTRQITWAVIITMFVSFLLFWLTVKLFDKYLF
jgi:uncharacterized membrane protein